MRREDLETGGLYLGPEGKCYEVVDLAPGWKVNARGEWVPDNTTRTRYIGNRRSAYRTNLFLKAVLHEGELRTNTVVDPRTLRSPWTDYVNEQELASRRDLRAQVVRKSLVAVLRTHPAYGFRPASSYTVSKSGASMTLPTDDVLLLLELAQPEMRPAGVGTVPQIDWLSP